MWHREQTREARRIVEAVIAAIVDPRGDPAEAKSVETEIGFTRLVPPPACACSFRALTSMSVKQPLRQQRMAERAACAVCTSRQ
jgi:hypothetical protein